MYDILEFGDRVRVIRNTQYPKHDLKDKIGIVRTAYYGSRQIPVEFMDAYNDKSKLGYFYFKQNHLERVKDENDILEEKTMENKITNYFNAVRVHFFGDEDPSRRIYVNFDPSLTVGDACACKWCDGGKREYFGVAHVVEILYETDIETTNEIIAKIDVNEYNTRVENRKKAAELKAKMQERAKKLQDIALYQMLAEKDAEMANMLAEYQDLV